MVLYSSVADRMETFSSTLSERYADLIYKRKPPMGSMVPHQIVAEALDLYGGIICPAIYLYCGNECTGEDVAFLSRIASFIDRVFEIALDAAKRLGLKLRSGLSYVTQFNMRPHDLFSQDYFANMKCGVFLSLQERRERVAEHLCRSFRRFLDWLRTALRHLEALSSDVDPMRPIVCGPYARDVVQFVDRKMGLIVLRGDPREGSQPFHIRPGSNKVWETLRALCETTDPEGYVTLNRTYAADFHHTDKDNETIADDYERLVRHIVPGPEKGLYRLEREAKRPLLRGV